MSLSEEIRRKLITTFKAEQAEHIQTMTENLLALEKKPSAVEQESRLNDTFRAAHSLKGAARSIGMASIESLSHALEDSLSRLREGSLTLSPPLFDLLYEGIDGLSLLVQQVDSSQSSLPSQVINTLAKLEDVDAYLAEQNTQNTPSDQSDSPDSPRDNVQETALYDMNLEAGVIPVSSDKLDKLLNHLDTLLTNQQSQANAPTDSAEAVNLADSPEAAPASGQLTVPGADTIRISVDKLDGLMGQLGELVTARIRAEQYLSRLTQLQSQVAQWHKAWLNTRQQIFQTPNHSDHATAADDESLNALLKFSTYNQEQLRLFDHNLSDLYREYANDTMRLAFIVEEMQDDVKSLRMHPLHSITAGLERLVRDTSRSLKKQASLHIQGDETELDKKVLEQLKDPLMHLVRNAVAHGIESPEDRLAQNKPKVGQIKLWVNSQGSQINLHIRDDGRGLDSTAIKASAVEKGLISQSDAAQMSEAEAQLLIFRPGLSTSPQVDDISGRGVGLDVVQQNIEALQGSLSLDSKLGDYTEFIITVPLTLASSKGLIVTSGGQKFILPFPAIDRLLEVRPQDIDTLQGDPMMMYNNRPVALAWLSQLLELPPEQSENASSGNVPLIILKTGSQTLGLAVEAMLGEQEIVIKAFNKPLVKVFGFAGASVLGTGEVVPVLHAADLLRMANTLPPRPENPAQALNAPPVSRHILVADDSLTVRTLEQSILEAAGYRVTTAVNGQDALDKILAGLQPDLLISDVDMPHLNGFELTRRLKNKAELAHIPVILVTSLDSDEDKARGLQAGADAYLVKSEFDQGDLLGTVARFV